MDRSYQALYIHIPFCFTRCAYCDFATRAVDNDNPEMDRYLDMLTLSIRRAAKAGELSAIQTIYLGGGTPSHFGLKRLTSLVYTITLSLNLHDDTEFTLEANPESLTTRMVRDLYALGVTRFSLGVQSFDDEELTALGRAHNAQGAREAIRMVQERTDNVSIDLMCGIPLQTMTSWEETLQSAIDLDVAHISVYPLTVEEETPFSQQVDSGILTRPDDDLQAEMMQRAAQRLESAGFSRYEVASYAKSGFKSRHNTAYWTGAPYLGIGTGAAGMRNTDNGRVRLQDGEVVESLSCAQRCAEDLMLGMRMVQGIAVQQVVSANTLLPKALETFDRLVVDGLAVKENDRYRPTERGWLLGNELYGRIWDLVDVDS